VEPKAITVNCSCKPQDPRLTLYWGDAPKMEEPWYYRVTSFSAYVSATNWYDSQAYYAIQKESRSNLFRIETLRDHETDSLGLMNGQAETFELYRGSGGPTYVFVRTAPGVNLFHVGRKP
jgi:hypothetical protein